MRRRQAVVVAVHLAASGRAASGPCGRAASPRRAGGPRPAPTGCTISDVDAERQDDQADGAIRRPAARAASPAGASRRAAAPAAPRNRTGSSAAGGEASGPNPIRPPSQNRADDRDPSRGRWPRAAERRDRQRPDVSVAIAGRPRSGAEEHERARARPGATTAKRISSSVQAIGCTRPRRHRPAGQRDHDQQEGQVAEPGRRRSRGTADRHVAQHGRDPDQAEDREHAPERAADQDQQQQRADGVGGDPLRGQRRDPAARPMTGIATQNAARARATSRSRRPRRPCSAATMNRPT